MTNKVTMPDPIAYCGQGLKPIYANHMDVVKRRDPTLIPFYDTNLYDDTRLEAYADAKVRAALKEAEFQIELLYNKRVAVCEEDILSEIRALIPKE